MTNPDTAPLDEIETFLFAAGEQWKGIPKKLNDALLDLRPEEKNWTEEARTAIGALRPTSAHNPAAEA